MWLESNRQIKQLSGVRFPVKGSQLWIKFFGKRDKVSPQGATKWKERSSEWLGGHVNMPWQPYPSDLEQSKHDTWESVIGECWIARDSGILAKLVKLPEVESSN